jgi:Protein of unknown function (DUF1631)
MSSPDTHRDAPQMMSNAPSLAAVPRLPPPAGRSLLADCLALARGRLHDLAADGLDALLTGLRAQAESAPDAKARATLLGDIARIGPHRDRLLQRFDACADRVLGADPWRMNAGTGPVPSGTGPESLRDRHRAPLALDAVPDIEAELRSLLRLTPSAAALRGSTLEGSASEDNAAADRAGATARLPEDAAARQALLERFALQLSHGIAQIGTELQALFLARDILPQLRSAPAAWRVADSSSKHPVLKGGARPHRLLPARDPENPPGHEPPGQAAGAGVAPLFDLLLNDPQLSEAVRVQIGRLQPLAERTAGMDRGFLARADHPLRQLLDRLAACAVDPSLDSRPESAFLTGLRGLIGELLAAPPGAPEPVRTALDRLDVLSVVQAGCDAPQACAEALRREESRALGLRLAQAEIARRTPADAPAFLREFLEHWWVGALLEAYADKNPGKDLNKDSNKDLNKDISKETGENAWARRLVVVDTLAWSLGPLRPRAVARLAARLPRLMSELSRGMGAAQMPEPERKTFLNQLMAAHARVMAAAKTASAGPQSLPGADPTPSQPPQHLPLDPESVDFAALPAGALPEAVATVDALAPGALVEFITADPAGNAVWQRQKLAWAGERRLVFLFTARLTRARQLSRAALIEAIGTGSARPVAAPGRYLDQALQRITGAAGAAQPGRAAQRAPA